MKHSNIVCYILLSVLLWSCQTSKTEIQKRVSALPYGDTLDVKNSYSFSDQVNIFNPFRILNINDDHLLLSERRPGDFFHFFSLPELEYTFTAGKNGRGPNEFMIPPLYIEVNEEGMEIYDQIRQSLRFFRLNDTSMVEYEKASLRYEGQIDPLNRPKKINDSTYFADYGTSFEETDREHIALKPTAEESLFTFGRYPPSELEGMERHSQFLKTNASQTNGNRFATFYMYQNRFKIFDDQGHKLVDAKIDDTHEALPGQSDGYLYRTTAYESEKYIYLLGVYSSGEKVFDDPDPNLKTSIEVWTWEGEPVYRAKFDRLIHGFTVSEKFKKIYGYSYLNEPTIFEYDLDFAL